MDAYYYFRDKYIYGNFNTEFLEDFLIDKEYVKANRKELQFRIRQLSPVQFLSVFLYVIGGRGDRLPEHLIKSKISIMEISKENFELFFDLNQLVQDPDSSVFKWEHFWWSEILFFSEEYDSSINRNSIEKFNKNYNEQFKGLIHEVLSFLKRTFDENNNLHYEIVCLIDLLIVMQDTEVGARTHFGIHKMFSEQKYEINLSIDKQKALYKNLIQFDLIDINKTTLDDWLNVLNEDSREHKSIIHFKMNNPQFNFFLTNLKTKLGINFPILKLEQMANIYNLNGKIKAKSLYVSVSKNKSISSTPRGADNILEAIKTYLQTI